jgi:membrane fusion protein, multidrug efflux system
MAGVLRHRDHLCVSGAPASGPSRCGTGTHTPNPGLPEYCGCLRLHTVSGVLPLKMSKKLIGRLVSLFAIAAALVTATLAIQRTLDNPRTADAEVFANYIGIAPQVSGPISRLYVQDNQYVHQGELLFEIDPRPYEYALQRAQSEQSQLEGQIRDQMRTVAARESAAVAAGEAVRVSDANVSRAEQSLRAADADVSAAQAAVDRSQADLTYAKDNLSRLRPLLRRQFITVDQVERAETQTDAYTQAVRQARAQAAVATARRESAAAALKQARAEVGQRQAQEQEASHNIPILTPYTAQRLARSSAVENASYDLHNTRIYAPFDARVTNLTISQGQYARAGSQVFTLIDARYWWVIGNFRETQLKHLHTGMPAQVFLMEDTGTPLKAHVESIGYGVTPDPTLVGSLQAGLPNIQRTLNWVHLATRYPVRIRIDTQLQRLRVGQTAVVVVQR